MININLPPVIVSVAAAVAPHTREMAGHRRQIKETTPEPAGWELLIIHCTFYMMLFDRLIFYRTARGRVVWGRAEPNVQ